jgi:excisionase family DNA binding protein
MTAARSVIPRSPDALRGNLACSRALTCPLEIKTLFLLEGPMPPAGPLYVQIRDVIRQRIADGTYACRIPPTLRVSTTTIYRLIHSGQLEALRIGRDLRIPLPAVRQYLTRFWRCTT